MCRLWTRIRYGVRWNPEEQAELALKALNMKEVQSIDISLDPFYKENTALRQFWHKITTQKVRESNPKVRLNTEIRCDGQPPYFIMHLQNGKKFKFKTEGFHISDLLRRLNRLMGNPEMAPKGIPYEQERDVFDHELENKMKKPDGKKKLHHFLT